MGRSPPSGAAVLVCSRCYSTVQSETSREDVDIVLEQNLLLS
jgi:hypothetical protein